MTLERTLLEGLQERRSKIRAGGGKDKIAARHEKGLMSARERIEALCQPHTFQESGAHASHTAQHFGMATKELPADGALPFAEHLFGLARRIDALPGDRPEFVVELLSHNTLRRIGRIRRPRPGLQQRSPRRESGTH